VFFVFFFLTVLGIRLSLTFARQGLYHLNQPPAPQSSFENYVITAGSIYGDLSTDIIHQVVDSDHIWSLVFHHVRSPESGIVPDNNIKQQTYNDSDKN
jgi:hypothetical protein